jgi:hypothetical protein
MITFTGVQMNPGCGNVPTPKDIAVGMCRITRYAGALWVPLAAHSILVAEFAWQRFGAYPFFGYGLLHDAHETVTGEVTRHYKPDGMKSYEQELDEAIFKSFDLSIDDYRKNRDKIKEADEMALCAEATFYGLKGWPDYYRKRESRDIPRLSAPEQTVSRRILLEWSNPMMVTADSDEQRELEKALLFVKEGDFHAAKTICLSPDIFR